MLSVLFIAGIVVLLLFAFVLLFGAPYLPTLSSKTDDIFDLLALKPGNTLVELGSGDGKLLAAAARRGIYAVGYELNPLLVLYTKLRYYKHRQYISVTCRNFWNVKLPKTGAVYVFLLDKYMKKLDNKIMQEAAQPVRLVSFAFQIPGRTPVKERKGLYLYLYE